LRFGVHVALAEAKKWLRQAAGEIWLTINGLVISNQVVPDPLAF
jgi:hypothetical protein